MNPLVVQTLLSGADFPTLERWFETVVDALTGAEETAAGGWTIAVGVSDGDETLSADRAAAFATRARVANGSFTVVEVGLERLAGHRAVTRAVDARDVLVVDIDVTVLASSIDRLRAARANATGPLTPRELPLGGLREDEGVETVPGCVLLTSAQLAATDALAPIGGYCQEAVVHRDRRLPDVRAGAGSSAGTLSVLEEAVLAAGALESQAAFERQFSAEGQSLLSIVMRTRVLRPEALRDALVCVAGQTDDRFELLLVVHNADADTAEGVLADLPRRLRDRTRVLTATGGTRSRPLNVGIAAARGSHVSFLDDDDLVFAHWVASVLDGADRFPRRLVRSAVAVQQVAAGEWSGGITGHRTSSGLSVPYPVTFDLADHLRVNMTPFMALGFPRRFFEVMGGADEELEVCEDWDLVLRAASTLGVGDVPEVTAVYRRWTTGLDSYTVHNTEVWERDMRRVRARLDAAPIVLPPGSATELADLAKLRADPSELVAVYGSTSWRVTAPLRAVSRLASRLRGRSA